MKDCALHALYALMLAIWLAQPALLNAQAANIHPDAKAAAGSENIESVQWASQVIGFSTEAGEKVFAAKQALGKPDKLPSTGMSAVAWMPDMRSRLPEEWIKVGFAKPMPAQQVLVGENARPGAVLTIYLFDRENQAQVVYLRDDTLDHARSGSPLPGRMLAVTFPRTNYDVTAVMVVLKSLDSVALHQIDAIGIADHAEVVPLPIRELPALEWTSKPENLGPRINSFYDEVFPVISPDGKTLYFDRKNHPGNLGEGNHDDIWISEVDSATGWKNARNAGPPLNNESHNFVCSISPDGNTLLLGNAYHEGGELTSGLSLSQRTLDGWTSPQPVEILDYYNQDIYGEYQLAANGKVILMAIERKDTEGKRDLYASFRMHNGNWSAPLHLGPVINSAGLEMSPFLAPDMRTLYFSSNGFPGYGNNDMFMSRRLDESWTSWSEPLNLGNGLNTGEMEAYYTVPASGDFAYFASANQSIGRTDLFRVSLPENIRPEPVVLVRGQVLDAISRQPLSAEIRYSISEGDSLAGLARSAPEDGRYRVILPFGESYRMEARAEGYFALQESLDLSKVQEYSEQERDLLLIPLKRGQVVPMREIFFPVNSDSLLPTSFRELDRVADLLSRYPALRIEIGGHTNDRCSESFCRELSRKRARSVAQYLYERGYETDRVRWVGYGSLNPIADNATEEGRSQNQRVEFKVLDFAER